MNECCAEPKREPRKPYATIELPNFVEGMKPGDEVEVVIKGKLIHMESGKRYPEYSSEDMDKLIEGEIKVEVKSVKMSSGKNEFESLLEDD